jgi:pyruvate/2-oxoglutarate dehydrogenase complex dihydrolipoamide dehydrogenase (E3) component
MNIYDLIIIGGGSAGLIAAETSLLFKKKVAIVTMDRLGGDCLWSGCIPSKALLHNSQTQRHNPGRDLQTAYATAKTDIKHAWDKIQNDHENPEWYKKKGINVYLDKAVFTDEHTIQSGEQTLQAKYFLIATGSRAMTIPLPGLDQVAYLTNENIFTMEKAPESLLVIGGGPIGCELGQAMQNLGSKVTIIQRSEKLIPKDDPEASALLQKRLLADGITLLFNTETTNVQKTATGGISLDIVHAEKKQTLNAEAILVAVGRQPNVENLGLENIGVAYDKHGIKHNDKLQTNKKHIYVAGDVAGNYQFTHYAGVQAAAAVRNIFLPFKTAFAPQPLSWCTFTTPEIAHTGLTEQDALEQNITFRTITYSYDNIDRNIVSGQEEGLIKILVKSDNTLIGATIIGNRAGETIHELALAIHRKLKTTDLLNLMHIYPTYSMGIQQALFKDFMEHDSFQTKAARILAKFT